MHHRNSHPIGDLIAERYFGQSVLGKGSSGIAVEDIHTLRQYALRGIQD